MAGRGAEISSELVLPRSEAIWHGATLSELARGFEPAEPYLRNIFSPGHDVLHLVRFDQYDPTRASGKLQIFPRTIPSYYASRHDLTIPSGVDSIQACLELASLVASKQQIDGIPVFERARFSQPAKVPSGSTMTFEAIVHVTDRNIKGEVAIFNAFGHEMARTTDLEGKIEKPEENTSGEPFPESDAIDLPDGYLPAGPRLSAIYHPDRFILHHYKLDSESEGTGLVIVGKDSNTNYFINGHRHHRLPEIKLVHAAMQTVSLIALQDQNPNRFLLPFYSGGNFVPVEGVDMGKFVRLVTKIERTTSQLDASAELLNPNGDVYARITDIHGSLNTARAMNRVLQVGYKRELEAIN